MLFITLNSPSLFLYSELPLSQSQKGDLPRYCNVFYVFLVFILILNFKLNPNRVQCPKPHYILRPKMNWSYYVFDRIRILNLLQCWFSCQYILTSQDIQKKVFENVYMHTWALYNSYHCCTRPLFTFMYKESLQKAMCGW